MKRSLPISPVLSPHSARTPHTCPGSWKIPINFLSLWFGLFGTFSINGIIQQVAFWSGFIQGMFSRAPVLWQDCASSLLLEVAGVGSKISPKLRRHFETRNRSWPPHTVYSVCSGWRGVEQTMVLAEHDGGQRRISVVHTAAHFCVCVECWVPHFTNSCRL